MGTYKSDLNYYLCDAITSSSNTSPRLTCESNKLKSKGDLADNLVASSAFFNAACKAVMIDSRSCLVLLSCAALVTSMRLLFDYTTYLRLSLNILAQRIDGLFNFYGRLFEHILNLGIVHTQHSALEHANQNEQN
jgi:hypothetical protein